MIPFSERAGEMGLTYIVDKGFYQYIDRYGEVLYRQLFTGREIELDQSGHPTDSLIAPLLAVYTKSSEEDDYRYCGHVSDSYKFVGNDVLNQNIRNSILPTGMPIVTENTIMSYDLTRMRNEIIIRSAENIASAQDILPVMIVNNSYDGTKAATVAFGISIQQDNDRLIFAFSLGEIRQVHIENSNTQMTSVAESYMQVYSESIVDMVTQSFNSRLTEDQMLNTLDIIADLGKKRKDNISAILKDMMPETEGDQVSLPSAWQVFLAIVRYSSFEPNLNIKKMLENAAESVLVIPTRMYDVLSRL